METETLVYVDFSGKPFLVGRLWTQRKRQRNVRISLTLASNAGVIVPEWRLENVAQRPVLLLRRFDRFEGTRIPFVSSMSMLNARDNEQRSYMEFVDVLRQVGGSPIEDMRMLWRRIVLNILISNTDDHLRNHGFLFNTPAGWRLSPAYDINPVPIDIKPRVLSTPSISTTPPRR